MSADRTRKVLVVEDEQELARLVQLHLTDLGCQTVVAGDGSSAIAHVDSGRFDLIVLDLMLPEVDGLDVCRHVRRLTDYTPILMLTARTSELDRVLGLEVGADDYLTKPFSIRELIARVKALFRRVDAMAARPEEDPTIRVDELEIDVARRQVRLESLTVQLTAKEFDLLVHFARNPGRVFTRAQLLDKVWGYGRGVYEHTVNSHINRLRAKIEHDPSRPSYVLTVWGVGYKFVDRETAGGVSTTS